LRDWRRHSSTARDIRALTEYHSVLGETGGVRGADDLYLVVSESGSEYLVDARLGSCECPDHRHREVRCKHIRRVAYAMGDRPVPVWIDTDAVDPQLGEHVDATPRVAATDGGIIDDSADDNAEILDDDGPEWVSPFRDSTESVNRRATLKCGAPSVGSKYSNPTPPRRPTGPPIESTHSRRQTLISIRKCGNIYPDLPE
jgi:hypothetical protein